MSNLDKFIQTSQSMMDILPYGAWCKNTQLEYASSNDKFINLTKIGIDNLLGSDDYQMPWEKYAENYREADRAVLQGDSLIILHPIVRGNQTEITIISRKNPIKDKKNNIVGVLGLVSIVPGEKAIKSFKILNRIDAEIAAQTQYKPDYYFLGKKYNNFKLTEKEMQYLFFLIRGKTSKEIAVLFSLSPRTIEARIENIKFKFNCTSKSELLAKVIEAGLFNIIPNQICMDMLIDV